jgi:hypothetical protein
LLSDLDSQIGNTLIRKGADIDRRTDLKGEVPHMTASIRLRHHFSTMISVVALVGAVFAAGAASGQSPADRLVGPTPRPEGPSQLHGGVRYVAPAGWTVQSGGNGLTILTGPVKPQDQPCEIRMFPPMAAGGDLSTQGAALAQSVATANRLGPYLDDRGRDVRLSREEGISGTGWAYADLSGQLMNGRITVRVLVAQMGDQVLPILGFSRTWDCLGNQSMRDNDVWALLFHSLQLPGYIQESGQLAQQLVGTWSSSSGSAGNSATFAPNGRYGKVAVYHGYTLSSTPNMVWEINRSWQGDGPYTVHGDQLHTQNAHGSDSEKDVTRFFSVVRMPNDNKPGGFEFVLRMVQRSWDGGRTWGFSPSGNYVTHMIKANSAGQ